MASVASEQTVKGGAWLVGETDPATVMTPEKITDEHAMIRQTAIEFIDGEVVPVNDRLEQKEWSLARQLMKKCGELGLLGTNIPEEYGGVDLDKIATLVVSEALSHHASFGASFGAQANLTILPIYMFGTEAQKQKYLPGLVSGEVIGAYGLSESGAGSDALGAKTRAVKQADGSFVISGEKMWITNGGFADVYIIFAKVDGEHFTAFIVERKWAGRLERQGRTQARPARFVDHPGDPPGRQGAGRCGARRDRQGPQGRLQRAELRPLQAGRDVLRRRQEVARGSGEVCGAAQAVRRGDRHLRRDQAQARRDDRARVRARKHDVSHRRPDRSAHRGDARQEAGRRHADADGARRVRRRSLDRQGARQRGGRLRHRREPADPRRQRLRARLPRRRPLPRCARQPHLRRHQRDQPAADPGHADEEGDEGRAAVDAGRQGPAGRDHEPVDERAGGFRQRARRRSPRLRWIQEGRADGGGQRHAALRHEDRGRAGSPELPGGHPDRCVRVGERSPARAGCGRPKAVEREAASGRGEGGGKRIRRAHRVGGAQRAGRDGRWRRPAHPARRAAPAAEDHAGKHRRPAPPSRRRHRQQGRLHF